MTNTPNTANPSDLQALEQLRGAYRTLRQEIGKIIVGQAAVLDELLMAIFCRGHALLVGVPGLAKTLMVSTLAQALDLSFKRIQFTPDLMPSDITGTEVIQDDPLTKQRMFKFAKIHPQIPDQHHDAIESPDDQHILVTKLCEGQRVTVLQLPVDEPMAAWQRSQTLFDKASDPGVRPTDYAPRHLREGHPSA